MRAQGHRIRPSQAEPGRAMRSAHTRGGTSGALTTVGKCLSSARESICPSFRAAPRILHSASASFSALASVMTTLQEGSTQ